MTTAGKRQSDRNVEAEEVEDGMSADEGDQNVEPGDVEGEVPADVLERYLEMMRRQAEMEGKATSGLEKPSTREEKQ